MYFHVKLEIYINQVENQTSPRDGGNFPKILDDIFEILWGALKWIRPCD